MAWGCWLLEVTLGPHLAKSGALVGLLGLLGRLRGDQMGNLEIGSKRCAGFSQPGQS